MEARLKAESLDGSRSSHVSMRFSHGGVDAADRVFAAAGVQSPVQCAYSRVLEVRLSMAALGLRPGEGLRFAVSIWQGGLPVDAVPQQGWIEMRTTDPAQFG